MRDKLREITASQYWVYGLSESDFDYTYNLAKQFASVRREHTQQEWARARREHGGQADDVFDDVAYYDWVESQYLWHFCLWRLQAVLEGLITNTFLPKSSAGQMMLGLKSKLDALKKASYTVTDQDYEELLAWAKLRNALSHVPPERYRPGLLTEEDILEYKALLERLCKTWRSEPRT